MIFQERIFEENFGILAALNFLNANVTFKRCFFKDNEGLTPGGHIVYETRKVWIYQLGKLATVKRLKADVSSVSPSSERIKGLWVALGL